MYDAQILSTPSIRAEVDRKAAKHFEKFGFRFPILSEKEHRETLVVQDQGFKSDRVEERLNWAMENFGIFPIWVCYIRIPENKRVGKYENCTHETDIGVYGIPSNPSYRSHEVLRAWQLSADDPVAWGEVYLKRNELDLIHEFGPKLEELRKKYKAEGSFKNIEDKITFFDPSQAHGPPMTLFRYQLMWRHSKKDFILFFVFYPFIKLGFLVAGLIELLVSPIKLLFPKKNSKSKVE